MDAINKLDLSISESVFIFQLLTYFCVSIAVVFVGNSFAVVIYPIKNDMVMRMRGIVVPNDNILGVFYSHFLHIL